MWKKTLVLGMVIAAALIALAVAGNRRVVASDREPIPFGMKSLRPMPGSPQLEKEPNCIDTIGECATSCPERGKFKLCEVDRKTCNKDPMLPVHLICY